MMATKFSSPDYVICCDCETPCYAFEWKEGKVKEAVCETCGNDETETFLTEEEYDAYAFSDAWKYEGR